MADAEVAQTQAAIAEIKSAFRARDALIKKTDDIVFRRRAVEIPEEYQATTLEIRGPLPFFAVSTISAALSVNPQAFNFTSARAGDAGYMEERLREAFPEASWARQERDAGRPLLRPFIWDLVSKGIGVMKTMECRKQAWDAYYRYGRKLKGSLADIADQDARDRVYNAKTDEYKQRDSLPYPLMSTDVPPESFYYVQGERGYAKFVESSQVPYFHALESTRMALDAKGKVVPEHLGLPSAKWSGVMSGVQTINVDQLWHWDKVVYVLTGPGDSGEGQGQEVTKPHRYGDKYTHTLKGPYFVAHGLTTSSRRIEHQGVSLLFAFLDLYPTLDALMTMQGQVAFRYSYPSYVPDPSAYHQGAPPAGVGLGPKGDDETDETMEELVARPNRLMPYPVKPLELGQMGPEFEKFANAIGTFLQMVLPPVVQGVFSGDESGYLYNQAAHFARLAWDPVVKNAEMALSRRASYENEIIDTIIGEKVFAKGNVPVGRWGKSQPGVLGIGPDEIKGNYALEVTLKPETPSNLIMEARQHEQLVNNQFESWEDAVEALGGNPAIVERQNFERAVKQSLIPDMVAEVRQRVGLTNQQTMAEAAGALQQADQQSNGLGALGQVFEPQSGHGGMPMVPTPAGAGGGAPGPNGTFNPNQPNTPNGALPLPGQG